MDKINNLIKSKVLSKQWSFTQISNLAETITGLSQEVWSEMSLLERIDIIREIRINETLVGMPFEQAIRTVVLAYLKGEIADIIKNMLSNATINFGGNKNEISEGSMGGEPHKERTADEENDSIQ